MPDAIRPARSSWAVPRHTGPYGLAAPSAGVHVPSALSARVERRSHRLRQRTYPLVGTQIYLGRACA